MLHASIDYSIDNVATKVGLTVEPAANVSRATLHLAESFETRRIDGQGAWPASGFALLASALARFQPELSAVTGGFTNLKIQLTSTSNYAVNREPLCVITLSRAKLVGLAVTGPVLRMTKPLNDSALDGNLSDLLQQILEHCEPTIASGQQAMQPVPTYSGDDGEPFIFVEDIPVEMMTWFTAYTALTNPSAIQRHGQTAVARAYENFCSGLL